MRWPTYIYVGALAALIAGSMVLSYSGTSLPGPDESNSVSLRDVKSRRSHFLMYYALGK